MTAVLCIHDCRFNAYWRSWCTNDPDGLLNLILRWTSCTTMRTLITNNLYFLTVLGVIIHYLRIVMSNFSTKNTSKRIMYKVMQI